MNSSDGSVNNDDALPDLVSMIKDSKEAFDFYKDAQKHLHELEASTLKVKKAIARLNNIEGSKPQPSKLKKEKLPSSFWIPRESAEALLRNRASAVQIGVYLVIAKHTDKSGRVSTTGTSALRNRLGLGDKQIHAALEYLQNIRVSFVKGTEGRNNLIYNSATWNDLVAHDTENFDEYNPGFAALPIAVFFKSKRVRNCWVVNNVGSDRYTGIWFDSGLIGNNKDECKPLSDIIRLHNSDSIMRFLLMMHYYYDLDVGGIHPKHIRGSYTLQTSKQEGDYLFYRFKFDRRDIDLTVKNNVYSSALGNDTVYDESETDAFLESALKTLDRLGLISRIVMAWSKADLSADSVPLYQLDQKSDFHQIPRNKAIMMADHIEKVAHNFGIGSSKGNNGFYDTYTVVTPTGISPTVVQVYKPTHVVSYRSNRRVRQALQQYEHNALSLRRVLIDIMIIES
jgi:hypothetical protein